VDVKKIDSVTLPVKDDAKSAKWYAATLGFAEIWRMEDRKGVAFEGATQTLPGIARFAGFRDRDGNRIALLDYPSSTVRANASGAARRAYR
jgi:catechol 2,3-dioxygenase-like lactoylglutathione lyase family enzyme